MEKEVVTATNWNYGDRVVRGRDWRWADQDKDSDGNQREGTIVEEDDDDSPDEGWIYVRWDHQTDEDVEDYGLHMYRLDNAGCYDLYFAEPTIEQLFQTLENRIAHLDNQST